MANFPVKEYDCWLQSWSAFGLPEGFEEPLSNIRKLAGGEITETARAELERSVELVFNVKQSGAKSGGRQTIIGTAENIKKEFGIALPAQKPEGFLIKFEGKDLIISGGGERGVLYGVFRLIMLLRLGKINNKSSVSEAPAVPRRIINHWDNLDGSIERGYSGNSLFYKDNRIDYDKDRLKDYARLLASAGINRISVNNPNVREPAAGLITEEYLPQLAEIAGLFRPFGVRILISINFASPYVFGELKTADPLDEDVARWWKEQADIIYKYIPDMAGFVVKADSEFEPGPFQYGRNHAEGANMLARALQAHGGELIWRCFVYNCAQDWRDQTIDRARAAYDNFMPLDGLFLDNVFLQIKYGPYDFQVREPVSPLFGALKKTRHILELQITQEYTGQQIDLCFLPSLWQDIMDFDTGRGENGLMKKLLGADIEGISAVSNTGLDKNWTGHTLAQANLYGYGRLAWDPSSSAYSIASEWSALSFGGAAALTTEELLLRSYKIYEKYNAPFGLCFMVNPAKHYGPNPEGYEFSKWGTYHRAGSQSVGIDRSKNGTAYSEQYSKKNAEIFGDIKLCPENLMLFFHRVRYDYVMKNGKTLLQNIYNSHFEAYDEALLMLEKWRSLEHSIDSDVYNSVLKRFELQIENAREWRDVINTYFYRMSGKPDEEHRKIYD